MRYLILLSFAALAGCYASHEAIPFDAGNPATSDAAPVCPRVEYRGDNPCTFENRYDVLEAFHVAARRLHCYGSEDPHEPSHYVPPVCRFGCDDTHALEAFACATDCADLYHQDRLLCGP